ncbi:hypothetical protein [Fibrobacter sp. UWEL]|nr:hypothetical protein [Fibrobacter sp. UWEL]SHK52722.1 hypothetical protein SAMN05720468_1033 [Fibrobacter sp. UWEL]
MNNEIEKKEYVVPQMTVIDLETEACLLSCSGSEGGIDCYENIELE